MGRTRASPNLLHPGSESGLYLADDSPPSTLVTALQLHPGRLDAGDFSGVRSHRSLGDRVRELRELRDGEKSEKSEKSEPGGGGQLSPAQQGAARWQDPLSQACPKHPACREGGGAGPDPVHLSLMPHLRPG